MENFNIDELRTRKETFRQRTGAQFVSHNFIRGIFFERVLLCPRPERHLRKPFETGENFQSFVPNGIYEVFPVECVH